jgi:rhodanese-related sulfurtransferase
MFMKRKNLTIAATLIIAVALAFNGSLALAKEMTDKDFIAEAKKHITTISVADAKALFDKGGVSFLDVRTAKEFKAGHIPGAVNVPRGLIEFKVGKKLPDKNAVIVVYCKSGGRSSLSSDTLVKMGYKNIRNMDGGWKAWTEAGYPVD